MKHLQGRVHRLIDAHEITDELEAEKLVNLLRTKNGILIVLDTLL